MTASLNSRVAPGPIIYRWWTHALGDRNSPTARALTARLRSSSGIQALAEPAVHELARRLMLQPTPQDSLTLLRLASVLPWVREHDASAPLAQRLGAGDPPALSVLRFQRLMRAEREDLSTALRRALALVQYRCDVASLGTDLLYWGDATRTRWAFLYFGAQPPSAGPDNLQHEETHA